MEEPKWPYSWNWTELDELRLSGAANDLDSLANELSSLAQACCIQGKNGLSSDLITDAGSHYEDELDRWKQKIESEVVANLRTSASAIRSTVAERQTLWDQFQREIRKLDAWTKEQAENLAEQAKNLVEQAD